MIRVLVLSPFLYSYGNKGFYVACGESFFVDPATKEGKDELKFLLSSTCPYKAWIWIEKEQLDSNLLQEVEQDEKGEPLPDSGLLENQIVEEAPLDLSAPVKEPEENPFLNPEIHEVVEEQEAEEVKPVEAVQEDAPAEVAAPVVDPLVKAKRASYLDSLHWTKLEKLAQSLGLEYTNKAETIEAILAVEFPQ